MNQQLPEHCNQCHNQCPADQLRCGRGKAYFEAIKNGETPQVRKEPESDTPLVRLLSRCGQAASHKSERMRAHGKDDSEMFHPLSQDEQAQLQNLLTKLETTWQEEHRKHHGSHGGSHAH